MASSGVDRGSVLIPGRSGVHERSLANPFWASVARMQPGTLVRHEAAGLLEVVEGPRYGRPEVNDVSVVVRCPGTARRMTVAAWTLEPCGDAPLLS